MLLQENWEDGYVTLTTPTSLPELKERPTDFYDRQRTNDSKIALVFVCSVYVCFLLVLCLLLVFVLVVCFFCWIFFSCFLSLVTLVITDYFEICLFLFVFQIFEEAGAGLEEVGEIGLVVRRGAVVSVVMELVGGAFRVIGAEEEVQAMATLEQSAFSECSMFL